VTSGPILHLDLDAFFASVEQRDNPLLYGKPVVVGGHKRGVIATVSYEARKYGLYSGMPLFKAKKICPQAIFLKGNFSKYKKASSQFLEIISSYSPIVEPLGLDEAFVDLTGTELLYKNFTQLILEIKRRVKKEIGITVSVGLSWQKNCAKIASDINKPDGFLKVEEGKEKDFLAPLILRRLPGIGQKTVETLNSFGIYKVGELFLLGPQKAKLLLGRNGIRLWRIAAGKDNSRVTPPSLPKSVSRSTTFAFDSKNEEFIKGVLFYLCQKVATDLRKYKVESKITSLIIKTYQFASFSRQQTGPPTCTAKEIYERSLWLLDNIWNKTIPLRLIGVKVSGFGKTGSQLSLFDKKPFAWLAIEETADKIREKYGFLTLQPASVLKLKDFILIK